MVNPSELEKVEFSTAFRGYNADQVDEYVDKVVQKYSEAYNNALEYEKLCKSQLEKIQLLERKLAACDNELNEFKDKTSDPYFAEFSQYKEKALELKELIRDFKANIFNLYQGQIKELQSFEFDPRIDEIIGNHTTDEKNDNVDTIAKNDSVESDSKVTFDAVESADEETELNAELIDSVSESIGAGDDTTSADEMENTNIENLISEISNLLNVDTPQCADENAQSEPESTKVSMAKKIFDGEENSENDNKKAQQTINPTGKATNVSFNNMFITE